MRKILLGLLLAASSLMAADGAAIFKKCSACHGPQAEKPGLGKGEPIAGWDKKRIVDDMKGYKAGTLNRFGMGAMMKGQMSTLTDEDMEAVAEYVSKLKK